MTRLLEEAFAQASRLPDAEQDAVAARLLQTLVEFEQEKQQTKTKPRPQFGSAKGLGYMTPDFEEPLEEFKEYTGKPRPQFGSAKEMFTLAPDFDDPITDFEE